MRSLMALALLGLTCLACRATTELTPSPSPSPRWASSCSELSEKSGASEKTKDLRQECEKEQNSSEPLPPKDSPPPPPPIRTASPVPTTRSPTVTAILGPITEAFFNERLVACNAFPNGSANDGVDTGRFFVTLPMDIFPDISGFKFETVGGDAKAGWVSNAGDFGYAGFRDRQRDCWSYYFEFVGSGETDLVALSPVEGAPEYRVHFVVRGP